MSYVLVNWASNPEIRILDYLGHTEMDVDAILREKHEYNKTRPYKHGKKF